MSRPTVPPLSGEERADALKKAMQARQRRAKVLDLFRRGYIGYASILATDEEALKRIRVFDLVRCVDGVGDVKARKVMKNLKIAHSRRVRGLGPNQRAALAHWFSLNGKAAK